jgi:hypothetical protein
MMTLIREILRFCAALKAASKDAVAWSLTGEGGAEA